MIKLAVRGRLLNIYVCHSYCEGEMLDKNSNTHIRFRSKSQKIAKEITTNSYRTLVMEGQLKNNVTGELILIVTKVNGVEDND